MSMSSPDLRNRLRDIVGTAGRSGVVQGEGGGARLAGTPEDLEIALGGSWLSDGATPCLIVERRLAPDDRCGAVPIGSIASTLATRVEHAGMLGAGPTVEPPLLFFDLETTGLGGGAGTYAFLVGCGWFDEDGAFLTRQFFLAQPAAEAAMLARVAAEFDRCGALVSFNGRSFDAPLLETRYLFHRLGWRAGDKPHFDALHPARAFWGAPRTRRHVDGAAGGPWLPTEGGCSLQGLERQILGAARVGDVPGSEIPERYFGFLRTGRAAALGPVLEHNRLDLLSLAGLTARLFDLMAGGPSEARSAGEALALGRTYARAGADPAAHRALEHALHLTADWALERDRDLRATAMYVRVEALRLLALLARRARRYDAAAERWSELLAMDACPPSIAQMATEALAVHHEHRVRDLVAAKGFALRSLEGAGRDARADAVRHRLARIERKLVSGRRLPFPSSPSLSPPSCGSPMSGRRTSS
jgi:uncharacterized protein YprB with RNaseH-like and TPR domain